MVANVGCMFCCYAYIYIHKDIDMVHRVAVFCSVERTVEVVVCCRTGFDGRNSATKYLLLPSFFKK